MAGRVERRINDKLYFVLDEVGCSSDCESEIASDIDTKPVNNSKQSAPLSNSSTEGASGSKNYVSSGETKNDKSFKSATNITRTENNISKSSNLIQNSGNKSEADNIGRSQFTKKISSENTTNNCDLWSDKISDVIDMEIDSDSGSITRSVEPLVRVTFRDEAVEDVFKSSLFKFFSQKIKDCTIITNSENNLEFEVYDKDPAKLLKNDFLEFDLDTTPGTRHSDVIHYGKSHDLVLNDKSEEKTDSNQDEKLTAPTAGCFNCLRNHNLRDCPEIKDLRTINKNRLKFLSNKKALKNRRYHLDENQKFSHIVPGVISKKLRNALNLRRDQQPGFIYRMRLLGYPPAWLEEAKVSHSGVAMYDDIGVPVLEEDEEEGEIVPEGAKDKYDITKIIEFPGFNVPLPASFKDESKFYCCPALSSDQSKENMLKTLEPKIVQAYVKKSASTSKVEENSPTENKLKKLPSPTIEEMEEKKRQLLMELNDEDSCATPPVADVEPVEVQNVQNKKFGTVKNSEFGTPILKSFSSFSKLPTREQFSVNVSDVINFENLPNSTGKYETMRNVITKIRISTSKTQSN